MTETNKSESPIVGFFNFGGTLDPNYDLIFSPHGTWYQYAVGYIQAASVLIEQIDEKNPNLDGEIAVFPIFFCFRHYLELMLKHFIEDANFVQGKEVDYTKFGHQLPALWKQARSLLEEIPLRESRKEYLKIERIIGEVGSHDPASIGFRYPRDKKGNCPLKDIWEINLANLYEMMTEAHESLGSVTRELSGHVGFRQAEIDGPPDDVSWAGDEECQNCD